MLDDSILVTQQLTAVHRCFPHIVNLAAQAMIKALADTPIPDSALLNASSQSSQAEDPETAYALALASDPIGLARDIISYCRASGQRREELQRVIKEGNKSKLFSRLLPELQLLRDSPTRWSSTYFLTERFYELSEVRVLGVKATTTRRPDHIHTLLGNWPLSTTLPRQQAYALHHAAFGPPRHHQDP